MVPAPERIMLILQTVHGAAYIVALGLLPLGIALATARDDGVIPAWAGLVVVVGLTVAVGFAVRYWRRRPILPGHVADYGKTALYRMGLGLTPSLAALPLAWLTANGWVQAAGLVGSLVALSLAPTSPSDYARHQELAMAEPEMPPDESWGAAEPEEVAPWEDEHGGHGHGFGDI